MEQEDTRSQTRKSNAIKDFLAQNNVKVFHDLCVLRAKGWESNEAERHFNKQRVTADSSANNKKTQHAFFRRMLEIAEEINHVTDIFPPQAGQRVLDVCMAPGAFTEFALRKNPRCIVDGITLPAESGGHEVLVRTSGGRNLTISFTDLTLHTIYLPPGMHAPEHFPDHHAFATNPPLPQLSPPYDLVICDGQRLRTHEQAELRSWEPGRLLLSQLILALTNIRPGGTMLVLLHRVEQWNTVSLLYRFSQFADINLFKPKSAHATRSSFYLIATTVRPDRAAPWVSHLRHCWARMTFGGEEGRGTPLDGAEDLEVDDVLGVFGSRLISLGYGIWETQRDALNSSKWIRGSGSGS
ncbi:hypothetical protein C7212DRAFT_340808 [Tuber magnatum]|uniref:Ribosomal RNA methyltransferase FtsJ domain-containing protein n=1 Tax=Tuber magnatum TaxID=42249 RepID=A0A317T4A9_9PEZI|nr:hypothetical protein C7212DRAFT_340808 [Tuber magnatum]